MDRLLNDIPVQRSGPVASAISAANLSGIDASGEIPRDAPHWAIEPFIPIQTEPLEKFLLDRDELSDQDRDKFRHFCDMADSIHHDLSHSYHRRFAAAYAGIDPDNDCRDPFAAPPSTSRSGDDALPASEVHEIQPASRSIDQPAKAELTAADTVLAICDQILKMAGYKQLGQADIEQCAATVSQFGVPLYVDFDLFARLEVYARGDIVGTRQVRRLRNLYRSESVSVPTYQRMVVMFQLADDDSSGEELLSSALHLRMFKNIPKLDIDMLLPGTRVRIRGVDRAKFILPGLGGFLMSLRRLAQYTVLFTAIALSKSVILVVLIVAFLIKGVTSSIFGYFQTKKHYQLNLTRNLYFQKLDSNAGVAYRIIQQAERQSIVESMLAYYGLLIGVGAVSERKLRRRCERLVREAIDVEVEFRVEHAVERLAGAGLIEATAEGWRPVDR